MALAPRLIPALWTLSEFFGDEEKEQSAQTTAVDSSCIIAIGWNPPGTISVTFKRGGAINYDYPGTYEQFREFVDAPSKGAFFNANFR